MGQNFVSPLWSPAWEERWDKSMGTTFSGGKGAQEIGQSGLSPDDLRKQGYSDADIKSVGGGFGPTWQGKLMKSIGGNSDLQSSLTNMSQPRQAAPPVQFNIPQAAQFQAPDTSFLQRRNNNAFFGG